MKSAGKISTLAGNEVAPRTGGRGLKYDHSTRITKDAKRRPPHRGAWIEIDSGDAATGDVMVAPRTGGRGLKSANVEL